MKFRNWLESEDQYNAFLTEIRPKIIRILNFLKAPADDVDDIAQKVLVAVWRTLIGDLGKPPSPGKFNAWLYTVTRNTFINYMISKNKYPMITTDAPPAVAPEPKEEDERIDALRKALPLLNKMDQLMIDLFYFKDKSLKEICDMLNIPLGTAKRRLHVARNRLAKKMQYV